MARSCSYDKHRAITLALSGLTNREIADEVGGHPNSIGCMLRSNGVVRSMRQTQAINMKLPRKVWEPLANEAHKRFMYPSTFIANLLRIIIRDNLLHAILDDEKVTEITGIPLTSPHICSIIGTKANGETQR